VPTLHEDDALRAARAAVEMREALADLNARLGVELGIRIGVNTGEVVVGDPATRQTFVTGDAVNIAKRLEQAAAPGEILLGRATRRLVANAVMLAPHEPVAAKGKTDALEAWTLVETIPDAPAFARRLDVRLVGRSEELRRLEAELAAAREERACRLVTVLGSAGIGKSRLAAELASRAADATVLTARCLPYGNGITFWPLAQLVAAAGGLDALARVVAAEEDGELVLHRVRSAFDSTPGSTPAEELFWGVRRLLEALGRERPLVVSLEDVHWAEPTFLDLVEYVAGWSRDAPILLLCLARPELLDDRPGWSALGAMLPLEPLSEIEADALLDELTMEWPLALEARTQIREAAEGNPLYVEQMVAMLAEGGGDTDAVPPTIQALLAARLDRLEPRERAALERASVLGREFTRGGVGDLSPEEDRAAVGSLLLALMRKELIQPDATAIRGDDGFRFRHVLIRDAAYAALPKERRAALHEAAADWLESHAAGDEFIGYHLEQAHRFRTELGESADAMRSVARRGGERLAAAGFRAYGREDMPAARTLLDRAAQLLEVDHPDRLEILRQLSGALWWSGDTARADAVLEELIDAAEAGGDRRQQWYALVERRALRYTAGAGSSLDEILRACEAAIEVFAELGDEAGLARAWRRIAFVHQPRGRFGPSESAAARAREHARNAGDAHEEARIVDALCTALLYGPAPVDAAVAKCREVLEHARPHGVMEANAMISLAGLLAMEGELAEARLLVERAAAVYEDLGLKLALAGLTQVAGPLELLAGDASAAERHLRRGFEIVQEAGPVGFQAALLAEALYQLGRYEDASAIAKLGEETTSEDNLVARVVLLGTLAKLRSRAGHAASALARDAVELAERTDAWNLQGDALVALAEVLAREGLDSESQDALARAAALYERKGNVVARDRAAALLSNPVR
jgi:tetratricopeptide (TPR) repeat protein